MAVALPPGRSRGGTERLRGEPTGRPGALEKVLVLFLAQSRQVGRARAMGSAARAQTYGGCWRLHAHAGPDPDPQGPRPSAESRAELAASGLRCLWGCQQAGQPVSCITRLPPGVLAKLLLPCPGFDSHLLCVWASPQPVLGSSPSQRLSPGSPSRERSGDVSFLFLNLLG